MHNAEPPAFTVPQRRMTMPFRTRPVTSYIPTTDAPATANECQRNRMSLNMALGHDVFDWTSFHGEQERPSGHVEESVYSDPFSDATLASSSDPVATRTRRRSSFAQSFKSGLHAMTRRVSLSFRGGKDKSRAEPVEGPRKAHTLDKRRSQLWDVAELSESRTRSRGLFNSLASRRRPSMPQLSFYQEPSPARNASQLPSPGDSTIDTHRLALLSPYVTGGAGARAAAAAQNEAMQHMRETPLPTYDAATRVSAEMRDSESGIGISMDIDPKSATTTGSSASAQASRCNPAQMLATELLEHVFCYLDLKTLMQTQLVSKKWAEVARSRRVWRELFYHDFAGTSPPRISTSPGGAGLGKNLPGEDHCKLYTVRKMINERWRKGEAAAMYLNGHKDSVYCIQFDENKIVTGSRDNTVRVWDARTYQCVHKIGPPNNPRENLRSRRPEPEPSGMIPSIKCEMVSPDPLTPVWSMYHQASVLCLQYDDEILVTGSSDFTCIVWSIQDGYRPMFRLLGHHAGVLDVCIDGSRIITCSKDTTIKVWDRSTGRLIRTLRGHRGPVNAVQVRGGLLASASGDGLSKLWRLEDGRCINEFKSRERGLACVEFSEDGRTIFAGGNDKLIYEYNTVTGTIERELQGHTDLVRSLHLDSANGRIISGSYDQSIKVWSSTGSQDGASGAMSLNLEGWTSSWMLAAKSNYRKMACASQDGRVLIVDFGYGIEGAHLVEA